MKLVFSLLACTFTLPALAAIDPKLDPIAVGHGVYSLKTEDTDMRVMEVTFTLGQKIAMHEHPKHVVYVVNGGKLMIHEEGKEPATMDLKAGDTVVIPAQKHEAQNMGKTKIKLVVTEFKGK